MHIDTKAEPEMQPIAIVGASCRFPGAPDLQALAALLERGGDAVTEIPADRWTRESFLHPDAKQSGKSYTFAAGIINEVDRFDAEFFSISPREAVQMDPQQRLLLELTYEALEDAGIADSRIAGSRTGVFVGGSSSDYLALRLGDPAVADAYFMTGATLSTLSNRISYAFDLHGPSFTVDTACSSSLVALHLACNALRAGEADMAVVGGVNLLLSPQSFVGFSRASMLSPRGRCHAFAQGADGYVRAEGGGVVLLKPLAAALADGDDIRGLVEATGVNSDGRTTGLSLPSQAAQAALLRKVYAGSRIDPDDLVYVEAHGTGTAVGDPIEAAALGLVLGQNRISTLPIGSIKTNIGHLESGSGIAGLLKALLVLESGVIPASLHSDVLNPAIDFAALNLVLAREPMPVVEHGIRRAAAVNSFGFGGTNAHVVISAAPTPFRDAEPSPAAVPPLLISARSAPALAALASAWQTSLGGVDAATALPLIRGAARNRTHHEHRLAATGETVEQIVAALAANENGEASADLVTGTALGSAKIAFFYSGNGSQWAGMGLDALRDRHFREEVEAIDAVLAPMLGWSVMDKLRTADAAEMRRTDVAQPLLFAIQHACTQGLARYGVTATAHIGHSAGEVAAALAAGILTLDDAARVITARSAAQQRTAHAGAMAVLGLGADQAGAMLELTPGVELAAVNSRNSVTVAGAAGALDRLRQLAVRRGVVFSRLDLDYAFHSSLMDPIRSDLLDELRDLCPRRINGAFYSTVFGQAIDGSRLDAEYWWQNVRAPVRFADAAAAVIGAGANLLVEIGPSPVLQSYLQEGLRAEDVPGRVMAVLTRKVAGGNPLRRAAVQVHVAGNDITGSTVFSGPALARGLPRYPWQRERFWYEPTDEATGTLGARREHPLLGDRRGVAPGLWFNTLDIAQQPWLADHAVGGTPILPAAAIVEMALAAARAMHPEAASLDIMDLEITRPLLLERASSRETRFSVHGDRGVFELASRPRLSGSPWTIHATGRLGAGSPAAMPAPRAPAGGPVTDSAGLYARTALLGLDYGPAFQTVGHIVAGAAEGTGRVQLRDEPARAAYLIDPARADGALQGLVAMISGDLEGSALLPWRIGRIRLSRPAGFHLAAADLTVVRTGPRSASADVALIDESGVVAAVLTGCWFTRVATAGQDGLLGSCVHTVEVPMARPDQAQPSVTLEIGTAATPDPDDATLLTEAYIATSAYTAIASLAGEDVVDPAALVEAGRLHPEAETLMRSLLAWLERDGFAARCDAGWRLETVEDLPSAVEIWRSILATEPKVIAEATLAGTFAAALPDLLARGRAAGPEGLATLLRHMFVGSVTGRAALDAICRAAQAISAGWTAGRPLRVLEYGAFDEIATTQLVQALGQAGVDVTLTAAITSGTEASSIAGAVAGLPGSSVVEWALGAPPPDALGGSRFDLVVGVMPLARSHAEGVGQADAALRHLFDLMAPGGTLLLVEPGANRMWDLCFGMQPGWWDEDGRSCLRDGAGWDSHLSGAGFGAVASAAIAGAVWPATLLTAQAHDVPAAETAEAPVSNLLVLSSAGDKLADAIMEGLIVAGRVPGAMDLAGAADILRAAPPSEGSLIVVAPAATDLLGGIAEFGATLGSLATALSNSSGLRLFVVVQGDGAPAATIRGICRVLANEAANLRPIFLQLDLAGAPAALAELVVTEIVHPDGETEIRLASGGRSVPRVRPSTAPDRASGEPARLAIGRPGRMDTLHWESVQPAAPGPGQVAVAVAAAGLNFRDVMWVLGMLPDEALLDGLAGATLGLECAGTVTATGPGVTGLQPGDRVMAIAPACLATHVLAPAAAVMRLPDTIDFASAATIPVAFLTVCYALGTLARLQPGETVLIHGGAGAVGMAAIQYAKHRGAVVFASAGSPAKRETLRLLGVDHVLDSRSLAFADEVLALTGGAGIDVVLNSLSGEAMERSVNVLRPFGRFLELGKRDFYGNTPLGLRALRHNVSYFAIDADALPIQRPDVARAVFDEISGLMEAGALRPLPHRVFDYGAAISAFRLMQSAGHLGKIVLTPEPGGPPVRTRPAGWTPNREGTYLVTGGLSGFGLATARWLAGAGVKSLALLSRTGGAADIIAEFAAQGVMARAFACDVSDAAALDAVLTTIRAQMLPLRGVVHAAMVLDDALLPQLTPARFLAVLQPKLGGALALDRLTRGDALDLFLLYSSVTTALGNPGQANYVAANAGLEALARARLAEGLPAMSIGWGPIGDVGYLARELAVSDSLAQRMGRAHLTSQEALGLLPALLAQGLAHVDVARLHWGALKRHLPHLATPLFAEVMAGVETEAESVDIKALLANCSPEEARIQVGTILAEEVAAITRVAAGKIDWNRPLAELGMDSLMAVELRMGLEQRFGSNIPMMSLADGSSIASMSARMVRHLTGAAPGGAPAEGEVARESKADIFAAALVARYEDAELVREDAMEYGARHE